VSEPRGPARSWLDRLGQAFSGEPQDLAELIGMLRDAERRGLIDAEELVMIERSLQIGDLQVRDVMVPRAQMVVVESDQPPEVFVERIIESGHSRFPVIGDSRDEIEGILLAKDLLGYFAAGAGRPFHLADVMRPAVFIPESKRLNVLLRDFRASRNHMAIVVDEYGGVAGLVTIEDVLEQIVGEIDDEHDTEEEPDIRALPEGGYAVRALTPIEEFNEHFGLALSDEEFDTIGGLVVHAFGRLPRRGESLEIEGLRFTVTQADRRRVKLLRVEEAGERAANGGGGAVSDAR